MKAVTGSTFAVDVTKATTQADCEKAGGEWDADTKKCSEKIWRLSFRPGTGMKPAPLLQKEADARPGNAAPAFGSAPRI